MLNSHVKILEEKRKQWRRDHPLGFVARPIQQNNGNLDIFEWLCEVPGPRNSMWHKGRYSLEIKFPRNSHQRMHIYFVPTIFHPNVDRTGRLNSPVTSNWLELSIEQILLIVQSLLDNPNLNAPENTFAAQLYQDDNFEYERRVCMDIAQNHSSNTKTEEGDFMKPGHEIDLFLKRPHDSIIKVAAIPNGFDKFLHQQESKFADIPKRKCLE